MLSRKTKAVIILGLAGEFPQRLSMNECEQVHRLLKGYLQNDLSAVERRQVARHLNLCASARKELDELMRGGKKTAPLPQKPVQESWDFKVLNWLFKTAPQAPEKAPGGRKKPASPAKTSVAGEDVGDRHSPLKAMAVLVLFFVGLMVLTHFIQNPFSLKNIRSWARHLGLSLEKESPIADMILDFRSLPHWGGTNAPVAREQGDVISDADHLDVYWRFLRPDGEEPQIDFNQNVLVVFFAGAKPVGGQSVRLKRMETRPDSTIIWYEETGPRIVQTVNANGIRPWILQVIPKPPKPIVFRKIDS